ncbi:hypothetical protein HR45_06925 [Shewanella mangrovi]|uniref:Lipoprotein n=1 Tax=Shewanella mangrovi TaxID=1515746 RepID=A0A094JG68_9GAMM|nr:hypothetical protein [Shewanella mangrovi]KFZ38222.1 hypothetical protein HR45_06925 [Shewanella mangrovi]
MKRVLIFIASAALLSSCASAPEDSNACGVVSTYLTAELENHYFPLVVTDVDGKPVISKPNYPLAVGQHTFTVSELIDDQTLQVRLAARVPKVITVDVAANTRYQLMAQFNVDKQYRGNDQSYWQPVIRSDEYHECQLTQE